MFNNRGYLHTPEGVRKRKPIWRQIIMNSSTVSLLVQIASSDKIMKSDGLMRCGASQMVKNVWDSSRSLSSPWIRLKWKLLPLHSDIAWWTCWWIIPLCHFLNSRQAPVDPHFYVSFQSYPSCWKACTIGAATSFEIWTTQKRMSNFWFPNWPIKYKIAHC